VNDIGLLPQIVQIVNVSVRRIDTYQWRITLPDSRFVDYWPNTGTWGVPKECYWVRKNDRQLIAHITKMLRHPEPNQRRAAYDDYRIRGYWPDPADEPPKLSFAAPLPEEYHGVAEDRREKIDSDLPFLRERLTL
jgi:hypothetical protein